MVGRRAAGSLYDHGLATYEEGDAFQHGAAAGLHPRLVAADQDLGGGRAAAGAIQSRCDRPALGRPPGGRPRPQRSSTSPRRSRSTGGCCPTTCGRARVHVRMLARQGLIGAAEAERSCARAGARSRSSRTPPTRTSTRAIERLLGELGPRVHAGRSRNDQVQTAMRLWAKDACGEALAGGAPGWPAALLDARRARRRTRSLPGYTHGQRAQPVWLGHHLAAHVWALVRDGRRFAAVREAADVCPLGAGALAGSSLPLDPDWTAAELGFARPVRELARRRRRPRLRGRAVLRRGALHGAPLAAGRGAGAVDVGRVRVRRARRPGGDRAAR